MESLFARPAPKRCRVCLMLAGSLLLHGGIVGFAAMWKTPEPPEVVVDFPTTVVIDDPVPGPPVVNVIEPVKVPVENPVSVSSVDIPEATPPPSEEPDFAQPVATPPTRRMTVSRSVPSSRSTNPPTGPRVANPGLPSGTPGSNATGPGTGTSANANAWSMPHPPYPRNLLASRNTGATTVRITTDASGRISNVEVTRSTGNPALDFHTVSYVRSNWHGPPNASRTTEFVYQSK